MIIGIDLGTMKSVVGIWQNQSPCIIPDRTGSLSIPSLVLFTPENKIYVGNAAKRHPEYYKGKNITISSVKRLLGRSGKTRWDWLETFPQEISAFILAELKDQAERHLSCKIDKAVIAIPSHFDDSQRRATKEAAEIAGLDVVRLLNEATAAALTYGFNKLGEQTILVFDFGGGTLDVSILDLGEGVYEVKCIEGDSNLGGDDFDKGYNGLCSRSYSESLGSSH
ncbi:MAG: Hsp70 family protein [Candidatus Methanofastidiosia archaeon]